MVVGVALMSSSRMGAGLLATGVGGAAITAEAMAPRTAKQLIFIMDLFSCQEVLAAALLYAPGQLRRTLGFEIPSTGLLYAYTERLENSIGLLGKRFSSSKVFRRQCTSLLR